MSVVPHSGFRPLHNRTRPRTNFLAGLRPALALSLVALLLFSSFSFRVAAQDSGNSEAAFEVKADKLLRLVRRAARRSATKGRPGDDAAELEQLSEVTALERKKDGSVSVGVTVRLAGDTAAELKAAGFAVGARIGDVATVETDVERLPELAALASVRKISAATYAYPSNDRARQSVGIDNTAGQRVVSQTGRGVVVGVIDTGIDFRHKDFTVPGSNGTQTRIKALLDMTVYGSQSPDPGWNYSLPGSTAKIGRLYTEADINAALQGAGTVEQKDKNGHGTHVAGTAAGNGLSSPTPGTYAGMAPEADLVIVKASRQNTDAASFSSTDQINALKFIQQKAAELNEPFVINMSLGGHQGPHDGTNSNERAIDQIVSGGPLGRAVCVAAGNEGDEDIHASGTLSPGGSMTLKLDARDLFASGRPVISPQYFELYYPGADRFTVTVTKPDGTVIGPVNWGGRNTADQHIDVYNETDPQNGQNNIYVTFADNSKDLRDTNSTTTATWTFKLDAVSVSAGGHFNVWLGNGQFDDDNNPSTPPPAYVTNSHKVSSPGTARGAITVGAYITRTASQILNSYAPFTNPGPTADGRQKPEISAPGYYLYSPRSADVATTNFGTLGTGSNAPTDSTHYTGLLGTSMATPVVVGSVALLLQANPNLTTDQIKNFITTNATHDSFTGASGWTPLFGFGKLNIAASIKAAGGTVPPYSTPLLQNQIDDARFFVRQHYLDFLNREPDQGGWDYWTNEINKCGTDQVCINRRRLGVSAAFFVENEFQRTGGYVYRLYRSTLNRPPTYAEFMQDRPLVVEGDALEATKMAYATAFVQRPEFVQQYQNTSFVDAVIQTIKDTTNQVVDLTSQRSSLISLHNSGGRAAVVRQVADDAAFAQAVKNNSFVRMEYFGYLRRDPDPGGEAFWNNILNNKEPNNYRGMVCAFLTSREYQERFGTVVTHHDSECGSATQ